MKRIAIFAAVLLSLTAATAASAASIVYTAALSGANESPPTGSLGTGAATVTIDLAASTMRVEATFSGLTGTTTAAHIHCCLVPAGPPNVGVATALPTFPGFPLGVTAGSYDQTFDLTQDSTYNSTFITNNGGTAAGAMTALLDGLANQATYFNIHTSTSTGGEIRGFLVFDHAVPEPGALALLGLALGALALRRRTA